MSQHAIVPLALITAMTVLSACSRPAIDLTGTFETISLGTIEEPGCVFRQADATDDDEAVLFVTYDGNLDHIAVVRYKGETIKLVPKEVPDLTDDTFDVMYEVIDYLNWQVRAEVTDGIGQIQLLQKGEPTSILSSMVGSCVS